MMQHAGERPPALSLVCEVTCVFLSVRLCLLTTPAPAPRPLGLSGSLCGSLSTRPRTCHPCLSASCQRVSHAPKPCRKQEAPSARGQPSDSSAGDYPAVGPHPLGWGSLSGAASSPASPPLAGLVERSRLGPCLITSGGGVARRGWGQVFIYLPWLFWGGEAKECGVL